MTMKKYRYLKRALDIVIAYFLLILCYVPMIVIALFIRLFDGSPVIFRQIRLGEHGRPFVCYKFRTMRCDAPKNLSTEEFSNASDYITPLGSFLRKNSLDELPQLFNVLAGQMSLIGPRPLIPQERKMHQMRRKLGVYDLRPGITGLAQICGRDDLPDIRKAECDAIYAQNMSFSTDARIFISTFSRVVSKDGVSPSKKTAKE